MKEGRIVRNVLFNLLRAAVLLPLELILIPFVLHRIGVVGFGIWALLRIFISYGNIFDFGVSVVLEKYTAEYTDSQNHNSLNRLINTSFLFYLAIALILFFGVFLLENWIAGSFFKEGWNAVEGLSFILLFSAVILGINLLFSLFTSLLNGIQRIDLTNTISAVSALLNFVGIVLVLSLGFGLKGIVVINGMVVLVTGLLSLGMALKKLRRIRLNPLGPFLKFRELTSIISYGASVQTTRLSSAIHLHLDKFFLSYFLGLQYVTFYEIASRLVERLRILPQMLIQPMMVAVSELNAQGRESEINRIYVETLRYMVLLSLPFFVFIPFFINPLMKLWLGDSDPLTNRAFYVLIIAHFLNLLSGPGFLLFLGIGLPKYGALCSLVGGLFHVVLGYLFIITLGYNGTLLATFISIVLPSAGFILIFHRIRKISLKEYLFPLIIRPAIIALCAVFLTLITIQEFVGNDLKGLILSFLLFILLYGVGGWTVLGKEDRLKIKTFLRCIPYLTWRSP